MVTGLYTFLPSFLLSSMPPSLLLSFPAQLMPNRFWSLMTFFIIVAEKCCAVIAGFTIINNEYYVRHSRHDDLDHSNFTVLLNSGAGVQVSERNGLLHVVVALPPYEKVRPDWPLCVRFTQMCQSCWRLLRSMSDS